MDRERAEFGLRGHVAGDQAERQEGVRPIILTPENYFRPLNFPHMDDKKAIKERPLRLNVLE